MLALLKKLLRPGQPGCPRFIVVAGDQPTYKMIVEMWLESWTASHQGNAGGCDELSLHEWLIPFPGFFHAEKQAMYSLCKELLHGVGLNEMAQCSGLSNAQVNNILRHSHARDNRAFLFSLTCAMILHSLDILTHENPTIEALIRNFREDSPKDKVLISEDGLQSSSFVTAHDSAIQGSEEGEGAPRLKTTAGISKAVRNVGRQVRTAVQRELGEGPNGRHYIGTVLFGALLPTVGFHVLSRTGHTDVTEAFWFRLTYILHASNHLKYQELSLFYAFLRSILPPAVAEELHEDSPGSSVMKLPSFTTGGKALRDKRGWTYVHMDEHLESSIVRHLKSLSSNVLGHLENAAAWLMQVSQFRALCRRISGASRSYGRIMGEEQIGEDAGPLQFHDRNWIHSRSVWAMLCVMRERGFLSPSHRGSEWVTNVFCNPPQRMNIATDQQKLLNIEEHGKMTTALHASVLFPSIFGKLTTEDREQYFEGRKFRKWTTSRRVPTPGQSMAKQGGVVSLREAVHDEAYLTSGAQGSRRADVQKMLSDRRREFSKFKDRLHIAQMEAEEAGDEVGRADANRRWKKVHASRHLISYRADGYFQPSGSPCHATKSRMLKYSVSGGRAHEYTLNPQSHTTNSGDNIVSRDMQDARIENYFSLQLDVMNSIHYRGNDGGRGTRLVDVVIGKMKRILRTWTTGAKSSNLRQIHLHIDDPSLVIAQKRSEQMRRDGARRSSGSAVGVSAHSAGMDSHDDLSAVELPGWSDELVIPWGSLIKDRSYKDELSSLHLICAAIAIEELASDARRKYTVYMYGGAFVLPRLFVGMKPSQMLLRRAMVEEPEHFRQHVIAELATSADRDRTAVERLVAIPRGIPLILDTEKGLSVGSEEIAHGESETRFVAAMKYFIMPSMQTTGERVIHSCVVLSDDTDVFIILLLSGLLKGANVLHVLNGAVHCIDSAHRMLETIGSTPSALATIYTLAGCDFLPGTYGVTHDTYAKAYLMHATKLKQLDRTAELEVYETAMCLAYLCKYRVTKTMTQVQRRQYRSALMSAVQSGGLTAKEMSSNLKEVFCSDHDIGSERWITDVRNFVADQAETLCHLIPPAPHFALQAARAKFVVYEYWSKSEACFLRPVDVGGCSLLHGYSASGDVVMESDDDCRRLRKVIRDVISSCACKGDCTSNRCSCVRKSQRCVGCNCTEELCKNKTGSEAQHNVDGSSPLEVSDYNKNASAFFSFVNETLRENELECISIASMDSERNSGSSEDNLSAEYAKDAEDLELDIDELIETLD